MNSVYDPEARAERHLQVNEVMTPRSVIEKNDREKEKLERLRDEFAMHSPPVPAWWHGGDSHTSDIVAWRWNYADEMMKAREVKHD